MDENDLADIGTKHIGTGIGRIEGGLFAKGNKIANGNPQAKRAHDLRKAAREAIAPEQIKALMEKYLGMALEGDLQAGRIVLEYTVGKPLPAVDADDEGGAITIQVIRTQVGITAHAAD
jgi:hypothetical protein